MILLCTCTGIIHSSVSEQIVSQLQSTNVCGIVLAGQYFEVCSKASHYRLPPLCIIKWATGE